MHFWKLSRLFLGLLLATSSFLLVGKQTAHAAALLTSAFSATASTSTVGTIRQIRIDPADGKVYVLGSNTNTFGVLTADGSTFTPTSFNIALPPNAGSDLAISHGTAYIVYNSGSANAIARYDISGSTAIFVASSTLGTGPSAITFGEGNTIYASKNVNLSTYNLNLVKTAPTSTLLSISTRLAYGGNNLFYLSSTGRLIRVILDESETVIATSGPTSSFAKGLVASSDGSALYYASNTTLSKLEVGSGAVVWTRSIANIAGIDLATSTGKLLVINTSGVVTSYDPINPVLTASSEASGTNALLTWNPGIIDADFKGVTIRRSMVSHPTNPTEGEAVTSSDTGISFVDSSLSQGTYYYTLFNQSLDGYYSSGVTSTVVIDTPPAAPVLSASATGSTVHLSWSVPADTASFVLRRDITGFPATYTDGYAVTTTDSSIYDLVETSVSDNTYYYSLFAVDAGGNPSEAGTASVTIDTTPPAPPALTVMASGSNAILSWDVPATTASFVLRRSPLGFPTSPTDGTGVTSTVSTNFTDVGLSDGTYYYSLFARDSFDNDSTAGTASTTIDITPPGAPSHFSALASGSSITLTWSNPIEIDFVSSTIRRSTQDFPTSTTDGTFVTSTSMTSYTDTSLADSAYYYSIFSADAVGHFSVAATSSAVVNTYVPPPQTVSGGGGGGFFLLPSVFNTIPLPLMTPSPVVNLPIAPPNPSPLPPTILAPSVQNFPVLDVRPVNPIPSFTRVLRPGDRGADVKALQVFLNTHGFIVAKNGQGSPGKETIIFGPATANAIKRFQEAHATEILKPYRLEKGTGIFGKQMMQFINGMK